MKKLLAVVVFAVVCLFAAPAFAQEEPAEEVLVRNGDVVLVESEPEEVPTARELLEQGLTVEKGATANVNLNENKFTVPVPEVTVENSIDFPDVMKTREVNKSACGRSPGWCAFGVGVGVVAVVALGAFVADQAGMFDTTNHVGFER